MTNQIIPVQWEKPLRKSAVNTLDKVNELIDFINNSSIHELSLVNSAQGREIISGTSTQLAQLEIFGESVQVVGAPNLIAPGNDETYQDARGVTITRTGGVYTITGTAISTGGRLNDIYKRQNVQLAAGTYTFTGNVSGTGAITLYVENHATNAIIATASGANVATFTLTETTTVFIGANINNTGAYDATFKPMLVSGTQATPYLPYGCIGLQTGETVTPIDLQGHTLAGGDILRVDSAGRVWIDAGTSSKDLGTLDWTYVASQQRFYTIVTGAKFATSESVVSNVLIPGYTTITHNEMITGSTNMVCSALQTMQPYLSVRNTSYTDAAAFKAAMSGVLLYYELATPATIELGTITPPEIPSGSMVEIIATLQPEFVLTWFTEQGLPLVVNDLKEYINSLI